MKSALVLGFAILFSQAGQGEKDQKDVQAAATRGLETLKKMVTEQTQRSLGFESSKEAAEAALGEPLRFAVVRLDQLKEYRAGADANRLLVDLDKILFPVTLQGQVRSSITLEKAAAGGEWKATGFGGPNLAKAVAKTRADAAKAAGVPPASLSIVQIPAFNMTFVARRDAAGSTLTSLHDHPAAEIKAGAAQAMAAVFERLAPIAQKDDGLPK